MRIVLSVKMRAWNKAEVYVEPDIVLLLKYIDKIVYLTFFQKIPEHFSLLQIMGWCLILVVCILQVSLCSGVASHNSYNDLQLYEKVE